MPSPFNYHHLYYFYTIAREQSVSRASESLRVSQPSLSAQLKQFETFLGLKLFERSGKKLILTEEGLRILSYAESIFNTGRELMDSLSDKTGEGTARIQIGISNSISKEFADHFLKIILKIEPKTHLTVHEDRIEDMLEELKVHALDLVLSDIPAKTPLEEGLENHPAGEIPIVFCAHRNLAPKFKKIPQSLNGAPLILPTSHSQIFHSVKDYLTAHDITPNIIAEIQDLELVFRLVLSGLGIAPLNEFMLRTAAAKDLRILGERKKPIAINNLYLINKKRVRPHPLQEKILAELRKDLTYRRPGIPG